MNLFQIFKAGTRTDNNGRTVTITDKDVEQAAAVYDPKLHEAPLVIGHPHTEAPAYGWVGSLQAKDGVLSADFAQMDDNFVGLVKSGRYKKVSASFYPPDSPNNPKPGSWYLRHVGFLGAQPPAVKGLEQINFAEDETFVAFSESENSDSDGKQQEANMSLEEQLAAEKAARETAEQAAADAKAELKRLQDEQEKDLRDAAHKQNADFAEGLVKEGRLKPADKDLMVQVLDFAEYPQHYSVDFGEGNNKQTLGAALRKFMADLPEVLKAGHHAVGGGANAVNHGLSADFAEASNPDALSHHERAMALATKEGISYEEAARRTVA